MFEKALQLQERGYWFESEISNNAYTFFKKKLVRSSLSSEQYDRWNVETKDAVEIFEKMIRQPKPQPNSASELPSETTFTPLRCSIPPSWMSTSYYSKLHPEVEIKLMESTAYELAEILKRIKFRLSRLNEGFMFYKGAWIKVVE